jgi:hypothetical protein
MLSIHHPIRLVESWEDNVRDVLEVGVFRSVFAQVLPIRGYRVTTADRESELKPDLHLDLADNFQLPHDQFAPIVCFQALEHLPYERFEIILNKFGAAARRGVVISLPYRSLVCYQC